MEREDALKSLERIKYWHGRVAVFDDLVAGRTGDTRIALLNLKIENSRNKKHSSEVNAIDPIVSSLQETVVVLNEGCTELKNEGRAELRACTEAIEQYIKETDIEELREQAMKDYAEDLVEEFQQVMICTGQITMKDVIDMLQLNKEG